MPTRCSTAEELAAEFAEPVFASVFVAPAPGPAPWWRSVDMHPQLASVFAQLGAAEPADDFAPLERCSAARRVVSYIPVDATDHGQRTALWFCARAGCDGATSDARRLLERGADVEHIASNGTTSLIIACRMGNEAVVRLLLQYRAATDLIPEHGSVLYVACWFGRCAVVRLLLLHTVSVDAGTRTGGTPLYLACFFGHAAVARLLLEHGAAIDGGTRCLEPLSRKFDVAEHSLDPHGLGGVVPNPRGGTPLLTACRRGNDAVARLLLLRGAAVDITDADGCTALYVACRRGCEVMVRLLLQGGASVNRATLLGGSNGGTPLTIAVYYGRDAVVKLLLRHGANVDVPDGDGVTPLMLACTFWDGALVRLLARQGANPLVRSGRVRHLTHGYGYTTYATSAYDWSPEISTPLQALQRRGEEWPLTGWLEARVGFTALHWACESRDPARVLDVLRGDAVLDVGARCGVDCAGLTALELASRPGALPGLSVHKGIASLVRAALAPWSPSAHRVQTAAFRRGVWAMLCVGARLRGETDGRRLRCRRGDRGGATPWPLLPPDMWLCVLGHCSRCWWVR